MDAIAKVLARWFDLVLMQDANASHDRDAESGAVNGVVRASGGSDAT